MDANLRELAGVVLGIEAELRRLDLWSAEAPSARALDSRMPFCYDTLYFHQWLQWVFLPRMKRILERGERLPRESDILSFAEDALPGRSEDTRALCELISRFDRLIAARASAP